MIWLDVRTTHNYWHLCQKHQSWEQHDMVGCPYDTQLLASLSNAPAVGTALYGCFFYDAQLLARLSTRLKIITKLISALCERKAGSLIRCIACEVATEQQA